MSPIKRALVSVSDKTDIAEFAKQLHEEEGKSILDAATNAARLRFRPLLMMAVSFILGVFPLVIATGAGAVSRQRLTWRRHPGRRRRDPWRRWHQQGRLRSLRCLRRLQCSPA